LTKEKEKKDSNFSFSIPTRSYKQAQLTLHIDLIQTLHKNKIKKKIQKKFSPSPTSQKKVKNKARMNKFLPSQTTLSRVKRGKI
jgi:hypothetical protein